MNTQELKSIIASKFSSAPTDVKENIFRVDAEFKHRTFARYYFDCTNSFLAENFDLLAYQQTLMADDYYKSNGPLQWNFYLYFVTDVDTLPAATRSRIESDKNFSRKLITDEVGLIKLFEVQEKLKVDSSKHFDNSLLSVWKEKLRQINLQGIYMPDTYPKITDVFNLFIERKSFVEPAESVDKLTTVSTQTGLVTDLVIDGYRSFKAKREFQFRKVNLVKGVNGTGKTSLLEAIELCICGQTYENRKKLEPHQDIYIKYGNGAIDKYTPNETKKFQERDRVWFGNVVLRGNSLSESFHVYNFFDSDTAARFAGETKGEVIRQIFSSLVLGEQTNVVFDRITRVYEKAQDEFRQISKEVVETNTEIDFNREKLNALDSSSTVIGAMGRIVERLQEIKWTGPSLLLREESDKGQFEVDLNAAVEFFRKINDVLWVENPSLDVLSSELKRLEELQDKYKEFLEAFDLLNKDVEENSKTIQKAERQIVAIDSAMAYLAEPEIQAIDSIEQRIIEAESKSRSIERVSNLLGTFLDQRDIGIDKVFSSLNGRIAELRAEQTAVNGDLKVVETRIGRIKVVRSELRVLGKEFILLTNDDNNCPLCNTHFTNNRVSAIIDALQDTQDEASNAANLVTRLSRISEEITTIQDKISDMNDIRASLESNKLLREVDPYSETIYQASDRIREIYREVRSDLEHLSILKKQFSEKRLTADGLRRQIALLREAGLDVPLGSSAESTAKEKRRVLDEQRLPLVAKEIEMREEIEGKRRILSQAFANYFRYDVSDASKYTAYLEQVNMRTKRIKDILANEVEIQKLLPLLPQENLFAKLELVERINTMFSDYRQALFNNKLRTEYLERDKALKTTLERIQVDGKLLESAIGVLQEIININNRENFLQNFFTSNKENILNIFRAIHLPNEFDDISFESTESIKLKVTGTQIYRDLTEISTGQKSAFILSLFLTLNNNIKAGPPMMLFDDPVAYVDDINTLSFLDFLRDQVINSDKQIFFSTANSKLANLFCQKFSFLDEDFKIINLEKGSESTEENV